MVDPETIETRVDVLAYDAPAGTVYRTVSAGYGADVVAAHRAEYRTRNRGYIAAIVLVACILVAYATLVLNAVLSGGLAAAIVIGAGWYKKPTADSAIPTVVMENSMPGRAADEYDIESHSDDPFGE